MLNPGNRIAANRQAALFAALTHYPHFTGLQIEVFDIKINQLGQTQPGTVHHLQHRAVAHGERIVKVDIQQAVYVVDVDIFRQMARRFRRGDPLCRVGF